MVITSNGEVQTNEEAPENFRDLELFVTVQILEDTLAVLSSGKLCEEYGYSYEWASGQKPQLINNGKRILCSAENSVLFGVPRLSSSSSASSSSTSSPQDSSGISSSPAIPRSDDSHAQASGNRAK